MRWWSANRVVGVLGAFGALCILVSLATGLGSRPAPLMAASAPGPAAATPATLPAVPDAASQADAERLIRKLFKDDYAQHTLTARQALARKLLAEAVQTRDNPSARYVLLREARDLAAGGGDADTALRAIEHMGAGWSVNVMELKIVAISTAARMADAAQSSGVAQAAMAAVDDAVRRDDFDSAGRLAGIAESAAGKSQKPALVASAHERSKEVARLKAEYHQAAAAMQALARNPDDPAARTAAGRYACLAKGDWEAGLRYLCGCGDDLLRGLAQRESGAPDEAGAQLRLANDWWDMAEKNTGLARWNLQLHAAGWYRRAVPGLSGISQTTAQKRLDEVRQMQITLLRLEPGLRAELFEGKFAVMRLARVDTRVDFEWGKEGPAEGMPIDDFAIRWTGRLWVTTPGRYTIVAKVNSSAKLVIDEKVVLEVENGERKRNGERASINLAEGMHNIALDFADSGGEAKMQLMWIPPGAAKEEAVPAEALYHDPAGK